MCSVCAITELSYFFFLLLLFCCCCSDRSRQLAGPCDLVSSPRHHHSAVPFVRSYFKVCMFLRRRSPPRRGHGRGRSCPVLLERCTAAIRACRYEEAGVQTRTEPALERQVCTANKSSFPEMGRRRGRMLIGLVAGCLFDTGTFL